MAFRLDTATGLRQNLSMDTNTNTQYTIQTAQNLAGVVGPFKRYAALDSWIVAIVSSHYTLEEWKAIVDRADGYVREFAEMH